MSLSKLQSDAPARPCKRKDPEETLGPAQSGTPKPAGHVYYRVEMVDGKLVRVPYSYSSPTPSDDEEFCKRILEMVGDVEGPIIVYEYNMVPLSEDSSDEHDGTSTKLAESSASDLKLTEDLAEPENFAHQGRMELGDHPGEEIVALAGGGKESEKNPEGGSQSVTPAAPYASLEATGNAKQKKKKAVASGVGDADGQPGPTKSDLVEKPLQAVGASIADHQKLGIFDAPMPNSLFVMYRGDDRRNEWDKQYANVADAVQEERETGADQETGMIH